jgi:hypothetical protein
MTKKRLLAVLVVLGLVIAAGYLLSSRQKLSSTASLQEALSNAIETVQTESQKAGILPSGFTLEITSPENGATVSTAVLEVTGKTVPGAEVFVNETLVKPDQDGHFRQKVTLQEGENFLLITAGNETDDAEVERTVYFELP